MKKRHLAKRRLRFESLEARLTMSAAAALNVAAAIPVQPVGAAAAVVSPLSSAQAAIAVAGATSGKVNEIVYHNWSGVEVYDKASGSGGDATQAIQAEWTVPYVASTLYAGTASNWVGVGGGKLSRGTGTTDSNLVQLGTQESYYPATGITYIAWWEVVGGPEDTVHEVLIPLMNIHPGDQMYAEVDPLGGGNYRLSMTDISDLLRPGPGSSGATFVHTVLGETGVAISGANYNGYTDAEVITIEATTVGGLISPLPQLTPVYVSQAYLTAAAYANSATGNTWIPIGSAYGFTTADILSSNPLNPFGLREKTFAYPGLATFYAVWLSSK
jgi:hypothetical protein